MSAPDEEVLRFAPDGGCFGCSATNPDGLALTFRRRGDAILSTYTVPDRFHGAPGIAHGGIVATLLDEVSCAAVALVGERFVVTGELSIRYLRACPTETPLDLSARTVNEAHPRYAVVEAEVRHGDTVLARSTGKFFYQNRPEPAP
jgi:acyl-coenzyme A thioesterase PaaI-like protein